MLNCRRTLPSGGTSLCAYSPSHIMVHVSRPQHAAPANDDQRSAVVTTRRRALLPGKMQKAPEPLPSEGKKSAVITTRKPSKLRGESVSKDVPGTFNYEEATAHFRAVIASKLRK